MSRNGKHCTFEGFFYVSLKKCKGRKKKKKRKEGIKGKERRRKRKKEGRKEEGWWKKKTKTEKAISKDFHYI